MSGKWGHAGFFLQIKKEKKGDNMKDSKDKNIRNYLKENILLTDGAMGTYFDTIAEENFICSEEANLFDADMILQIHKSYIEAGAKLIRSNTFSANRRTFQKICQKHGSQMPDCHFKKWIQKGYALALQAAGEADAEENHVFVAADIGPIYEASEKNPEDILREYYEIADAFLEMKADIFVLETFPDEKYVLKLAEYIRKKLPEAFIIGQFSFVPTGYSRTGFHYKTILKKALDSHLLDAVGFNCGIGASHMKKFLSAFLEEYPVSDEVILTALPNCGYPQIVRGHAVYSDSVSYFGEKVMDIAKMGVKILGGCCGTTPEYIQEIERRLHQARWNTLPKISVVSEEKRKRQEKSSEKHFSENVKVTNKFREKLEKGEMVCAVEIDPPFDTSTDKMMKGAHLLANGPADLITIADSPLARSRADSFLTAVKIQKETGMQVMPHLTCRDKNRIAIRSGLLGAYIHEIRNVLVVTGDPVGREEREFTKGVFDFNSIQLMQFLESLNTELFSKDTMFFGGALNQNGAKLDKIADRMKRKMEAGCRFFLTQPVYSEEEIERLSWLQKSTGAKILIGIMPLISYRNAQFIKNEMPGIFVPDEVLQQYAEDASREEWEETAIKISGEVISLGKGIGAGYYFMTPFHRVSLIQQILHRFVIE